MIRPETKSWFQHAGILAGQSARSFWFGIEMFLQDVAEEITRKAEKVFVRIEDDISYATDCLYHARRCLRSSWNWTRSDPLLFDLDPKSRRRESWYYLRAACFHFGRLSRLVWKEEKHRWNGPQSLRVCIWGLWFGGAWRKEFRAAWVIYNGRWFNFQVLTWPPRLAFWRNTRRKQKKVKTNAGSKPKGGMGYPYRP